MQRILVQHEDFDVAAETAALLARCPQAGAVGSFLGVVRSSATHKVVALELEHYPAMTQKALEDIAAQALARFDILGCTLIHRVGRLAPGANIVLVLAASAHRAPALHATEFLIDWLKTAAPFWKKEHAPDGTAHWVQPRAEDQAAAAAWKAP